MILRDAIDKYGAKVDTVELECGSARHGDQRRPRGKFGHRHSDRGRCNDIPVTLRQVEGTGRVVVNQSTRLDLNKSAGKRGNSQSDGRVDFLITVGRRLEIDAIIIIVRISIPIHLNISPPQFTEVTSVDKTVPVAGASEIDIHVPVNKAMGLPSTAVMFFHPSFDGVCLRMTHGAVIRSIHRHRPPGLGCPGRGGSGTGIGMSDGLTAVFRATPPPPG